MIINSKSLRASDQCFSKKVSKMDILNQLSNNWRKLISQMRQVKWQWKLQNRQQIWFNLMIIKIMAKFNEKTRQTLSSSILKMSILLRLCKMCILLKKYVQIRINRTLISSNIKICYLKFGRNHHLIKILPIITKQV